MGTKDMDYSGLKPKQQKIAKIIIQLAKELWGEAPDGGGCKAFYSPEEWKERGEDYGTNSELVVVYDGGDLYEIFNPDSGNYKWFDRLNERLEKHGYWVEACTCWYSAIYKN